MKKFFYLAAALSLLAVSCKEEIREDVLELSTSSTVVGVEGTTQKIEFTTNNSWTIASDKDWVTFDVTLGDAGSGAVNMSVAANDSYDGRSATVTLKAASKSHKINVSQFGKSEFGTSVSLSMTSAEQDITIPVVSSVEYSVNIAESASSWLTLVKTKAAPERAEIVLHLAANTELFPRTGEFEIVASSATQKYIITQNSDFTPMSKAEALYLGSLQDIYDGENYTYNVFHQYAVLLSDDAGNEVVLAINGPEDSDKTQIPAGSYSIDATAKHVSGTFSVKSTDGHEKYYTVLRTAGAELSVIDGEINISLGDSGVYTITALLQDAAEVVHSYSYQGKIAVSDKSFGARCSGFTLVGQYNTYYAGGAQEWKLSLQTSAKDKEDNPVFLRNIYLNIYGTPQQSTELPTGEFKYEVPAEDSELGKANGITRANPQTFTLDGDDGDWASVLPAEGTTPKLSITKNADGTYNFSFAGSFVMSKNVYNDDGDFVETVNTPFSYDGRFEDVFLPEFELGQMPTPDGDAEFTSLFNAKYMPFYYGHVFDENNDVFYFGFNDVNSAYSVNLAVNVKGNYVFVKNFANRFCLTPMNVGTFTFSQTPVDNSLIPLKEGASPRLYIKNTYSGTTFYVTGGSITLTDRSITYDLTAKPKGGEEVKFTGIHEASFYYAQDRTSKAPKCGLFTIE